MRAMKRVQSRIRQFFGSRLFLVVALVAVTGVAVGFARAYYQDYEVHQEIKALESQVDQLQKKKLESMTILKYVMSSDFVEDKARTELNLKKPGERVLVVPRPGQEAEKALEMGIPRHPLSNVVKWWYYFTKHELTAPTN